MAKDGYGSKLTMNGCILDILMRYSDEEHKLSQNDILNYLQDENKPYHISAERKSIKRHLKQLIDQDAHGIRYTTIQRSNGADVWTDFYIDDEERDYTDGELLLLIDSVIFSNHISKTYREQLVEKLEGLRSVSFKNSIGKVDVANKITSLNQCYFYNLEELNKAINESRKVSFTYNDYGVDKKLHPTGTHTVNPYRIVAKNTHFYLICQEESFDNLTHYRIDKINPLTVLEEEFAHIPTINMEEYLASHPYMSAGAVERIQLRIDKGIIGNVIDWFGDNYDIEQSDDKKPDHLLDIRLLANPDDLYYWALQYGNYVEVKAPQDLRDRIRDTAEVLAKTYVKTHDDRYHKFLNWAKNQGKLDLRFVDRKDIDPKTVPITKLILGIDTVPDLFFLREYPDLEFVSLHEKSHRREADPCGFDKSSLSVLKELKSLSSLNLDEGCWDDFKAIADLPLKELRISGKNIKNMHLLYEMPTLERLSITMELASEIDLNHLREVNPGIRICKRQTYQYE